MSFFKDLLTEKDGVSYCPLRVGLLTAVTAYLGATGYDLFSDIHFIDHAKDWASGMAEILGFGGGAVAGKGFNES